VPMSGASSMLLSCKADPFSQQSGGRVVGRYRVAPAVPRGHRQHESAGVRPAHRWVDAAAGPAAPSDAAAPPQEQLAKHPTADGTAPLPSVGGILRMKTSVAGGDLI
jgi:hypothetical protein